MFTVSVQINQQLQDFAEMLQSCCGLSMWCFGLDGTLISTTCPTPTEFKLFLDLGNCIELSLAQARDMLTPFLI